MSNMELINQMLQLSTKEAIKLLKEARIEQEKKHKSKYV